MNNINRIIKEEINRIINESFNSKIIQKLYNEHGGIDFNKQQLPSHKDNFYDKTDVNVKYILSDITDEMIGNLYNSKEDFIRKTGKSLDYRKYDDTFWIPFKDGSIVTLKKPNSEEGIKLYNKLFGNNGDMWNNKWNSNHKQDLSFYDNNYMPQGSRGQDYYDIMKGAKENNYRIKDKDKNPDKSIYIAGSNLDRYKDNTMINSPRKSYRNKKEIINNINNRERNLKQNGYNK